MTAPDVVAEIARRVDGAIPNAHDGVDYVDEHGIVRLAVEDAEGGTVDVFILDKSDVCLAHARLDGILATADTIIALVGAVETSDR